jgi:hypothetical protein
LKLLKTRINLSFLANPFYLYCIAFTFAILTYQWGWSKIYPRLSTNLILFFIISFIAFIGIGYLFEKKKFSVKPVTSISLSLIDFVFWLIIVLGSLDILIMGYIPILNSSHNYKEFGAPVIDVLFNTLSIFFSVVFLQLLLEKKKVRFLIYFVVVLIIQVILFRRSTLVWIITSSLFLVLLQQKTVNVIFLAVGIILIPLFSFAFGLLGNKRSNFTQSYVIDNLGASNRFKDSGLSHNNYIAYLYISSPLANLQNNILPGDKFRNKGDLKDFFFYCILPPSLTMRLEKRLNLNQPVPNLIIPELIVGSCFMISYCTMGFAGLIIMCAFILIYNILCLILVRKWKTFYIPVLALLSTTISLLIFDNILNRLDIILMLFFYPVFFHFINSLTDKRKFFAEIVK